MGPRSKVVRDLAYTTCQHDDFGPCNQIQRSSVEGCVEGFSELLEYPRCGATCPHHTLTTPHNFRGKYLWGRLALHVYHTAQFSWGGGAHHTFIIPHIVHDKSPREGQLASHFYQTAQSSWQVSTGQASITL